MPPANKPPCTCPFHKYDVVHTVAGEEAVYDHSPETWTAALSRVNPSLLRVYPSSLYVHGMTATELQTHTARVLGPELYRLLKRVLRWLVDPNYKTDDGSFPADWIRGAIGQVEGRPQPPAKEL